MMELLSGEGIQESSQTKSLPEGIGESEDSGFASIFSVENQNDNTPNPEEIARIRAQKAFDKRQERAVSARALQEKYNEEKRQNTHERLIHLVSRSKFYSKFVTQKLNSEKTSEKTPPKPQRGRKRKPESSLGDDEEATSPERIEGIRSEFKDSQTYLSAGIKERLIDGIEEFGANGAKSGEDVQEKVFIPLKYFEGELRDYQKDGLEWLKALYENGISGILADEMGLGKTVQVIAMIAHLIESKQAGPFLILSPLSTIPNWLMEFERFAPNIPVVLYHGDAVERDRLAKKIAKVVSVDGFKTQPVVLTTYEVPLKDTTFLISQNWRYLVVDEGHRLKNSETALAQLLQQYTSMIRLILTGTPLQNNLKELWSLLHFLMPDIFDDLAVFESWFNIEDFQNEAGTNRLLQQEEDKNIIQSFRDILKPFMLRRMKADVCLDIPPKKEVLVYAPMTELQHELYSALLNYDTDTLTNKATQPVIVDDEFGNRPKRQCTYKSKYGGVDKDQSTSNASFSCDTTLASDVSNLFDPDTSDVRNELPFPQNTSLLQKKVEKMKAEAHVSERNAHYFMRLTFGNRAILYKKVINHPYLLQLPLNDDGLPRIDEDFMRASGKFMVLDRMLKKLNEGGHRVLLFSTLTMILDVIEDYLSMRSWKYLRLDGSVDIEARKESITQFNTDPEYFLFLVSTRAGGVGLNLMGADTVIIFDSDFNPQADIQAMARCHRIGQTKPVVIYRLCTRGSYDEVIVRRAEAKRKLEKLVISKEIDDVKLDKKGLLKLRQLLQSSEHQAVSSEQEIFDDEELNKILDRSDLIAQMQKLNILETKI